jgi:lysozyme
MKTKTVLSISAASIELIKRRQRCCLSAYLCTANKCRIGYGHVIVPELDADLMCIEYGELASWVSRVIQRREVSPAAAQCLRINQQQADTLLQNDLNKVGLFINSVVPIAISQHQFDALCSLVFTIGQDNYSASTLREKLNAALPHGTVPAILKFIEDSKS